MDDRLPFLVSSLLTLYVVAKQLRGGIQVVMSPELVSFCAQAGRNTRARFSVRLLVRKLY